MKVLILAGGSGSRLWPSSRTSLPKQFLSFGNRESLLQMTIRRFLSTFDVDDFLIMTNQEYVELVKEQVREIDERLEQQVLIEPHRRNTAPAIALAVKYMLDHLGMPPKESFIVAPSDHLLTPADPFLSLLQEAEAEAKKGSIVVFGTIPQKPETGYGYIKALQAKDRNFFDVAQFVEKPSLEVAMKFLEEGGYLWNSGMFLFTIQTFLDALQTHCPTIAKIAAKSYPQMLEDFSDLPDLSIDYAIMEKSKNCIVFPLDLNWSDVGCWDSVYEILEKDDNLNVKVGNILDIDTRNCLILGSKRLISTIGLEDMLIVETEDAIFLGKKGESQKIRQLVEELKKRGCENL